MLRARSPLCGLALLLSLLLMPASPVQAQTAEQIGVVVVHGKGSGPDRQVAELVRVLRNVGFLVAAPEMPWSKKRNFDASYQQALVEIGLAVGELQSKGATRIAVAGHDLGGNAALGFAATRPGLFAVIALAPSHDPERQREIFMADLRKAREMVIHGRGAQRSLFIDVQQDKDYDLNTTAEIYLSYSDPEGPAVMPRMAEAIPSPVPLLWVVGSNDPLARLGRSYAFAKAPAHPASRYEEVTADHQGVPAEAARLVAEWLKGLLGKAGG